MQVPIRRKQDSYKLLRHQTRKVVARAMRKEAEQELNNLCQNSNSVFCFLKKMKKKGKNEGERCLREKGGQLGFIEGRAKIEEHMEKIMNEENEQDQMMETDEVEERVKK